MRISNKSNYPEALMRAMESDPYTKGDSDFSVTELISPAQLRALALKHADEIEEDVEDGLWRLMGQAIHVVLERANERVRVNTLAEKRYVAVFDGVRVSGQMDTLELRSGVLSDFKLTTAWGFIAGREPKPEWVSQLNILREILIQNGLAVNQLEIVGILRDHGKKYARESLDYPKKPIAKHIIPIWPREKTQAYIRARIAAHQAARRGERVDCSPEERWERPTKYAVMAKGKKRAVRLYDTENEARVHAQSDKTLRVEKRPGESQRCSEYCPVSEVCPQRRAMLNQDETVETAEEAS